MNLLSIYRDIYVILSEAGTILIFIDKQKEKIIKNAIAWQSMITQIFPLCHLGVQSSSSSFLSVSILRKTRGANFIYSIKYIGILSIDN